MTVVETPAPSLSQRSPRTALVSGGSRGLGRVLVERLLAEGWQVATFSRSPNEFIETTTATHPISFYWESVDLGETHRMKEFVRAVSTRFETIDLLINNAGLLHQELLLTTPHGLIESLVVKNLLAPMLLTQACARLMSRNRSGSIVNISSINAVRGFRGVSVYAAAKAGIDGFNRSLARELGPLGIRVNSLVPGYFESDMTSDVTDQNREKIKKRTPLGRLGTVDEVAATVLFLASPEARFITGQSLIVDGGITC